MRAHSRPVPVFAGLAPTIPARSYADGESGQSHAVHSGRWHHLRSAFSGSSPRQYRRGSAMASGSALFEALKRGVEFRGRAAGRSSSTRGASGSTRTLPITHGDRHDRHDARAFPSSRLWAVYEPRKVPPAGATLQNDLPGAFGQADWVLIKTPYRLEGIPEKTA